MEYCQLDHNIVSVCIFNLLNYFTKYFVYDVGRKFSVYYISQGNIRISLFSFVLKM